MAITINGTTGIAGVDGSASTPAVQGTDTNTGIFFPAADTIAFGEGGAEAMRIDSSGKMLVGTTTARGVAATGSAVFEIEAVNAIAASLVNNNNSSGSSALLMFGKSRGGAVGGTTVVQNGDELGEIRFAGADGTNLQSYAASIRTEVDGTPGSGDMPGRLIFSTTADGAGSSTERARITSAGKFFVNETAEIAGYSEQAVITANGTSVALALKSADSSIALATTTTNTNTYNAAVFANNGNFSGALKGSISVSNSATTYNTTSDYRLKENVAPMTGALATVAQLKPCTYTWKDGGEIGQGFIAHELQAVVPDCVTGEKDAVNDDGKPIYQGVDTSFLVATLTAAIQELKAELDTTKARLAALENK